VNCGSGVPVSYRTYLGKIRILRMSDGTGIPLEITKKQRTILEKLEIPDSLMS